MDSGTPWDVRWERELLLSALGGPSEEEVNLHRRLFFLQSHCGSGVRRIDSSRSSGKDLKLGPATLLFRHGISRVIRFCFSGWIFALPNDLARWWASTSRAESRGAKRDDQRPGPGLQSRRLRER